jgi:integrase
MTMPKNSRYPGIECLPDGRKRIRLRAVDPRTGRMREVDRTVEATPSEALRLRVQWYEEIRTADRRPEKVPRFGEYVERWMRSKALSVKRSTAVSYAEVLDRRVLPHFQHWYLDRIRDQDVRDWQLELASRLKPASVNGALRIFRMILADAGAEFDLPRNPCERIRHLPVKGYDDANPNILSASELARVVEAMQRRSYQSYALCLTLALTGLRKGEATALRWEDLDYGTGIIRVTRSQWRGMIGTPKTGKTRTVPMTAELVTVLREQQRRLAARPLGREGWVFPGRNGGVIAANALRTALATALKHAGIGRRFTVHGLRRSFNNLSRQVAGEIVTRSITGHVSQEMTEHYSHVGREEKLAAASEVVKLVFGEKPAEEGRSASWGISGGSDPSPASRPN